MDPDPLQWLWDGVNDFQTKFNDLCTRAIRNFKRPFDVAQHDVHCGLNNSQNKMPCSCCKGALTFDDVRRTLDHWRELLDDALKLIESLLAELFKSRAETQNALGEKERTESECIHAKLKLDQMQARLDNAQEAWHTRAQDMRARDVKDTFDQADKDYRVRTAKGEFTARLNVVHNSLLALTCNVSLY
jgi:hypothetical protein